MANVSCHVLLIEPNPATADLIQKLFVESSTDSLSFVPRLDSVTTLEEGSQSLSRYDILLLNINLFQTFGLQQEMLQGSTNFQSELNLPVIVISEQEDEVLAIQAIEGGAYGYLLTSRLTPNTLLYSLWFAIQKHQQLQMLTQASQRATLPSSIPDPKQRPHQKGSVEGSESDFQALQDQEINRWETMAQGQVSPSVTARLFDSGPLKDTLPDIFAELVEDYAKALDLALERRAYRVNTSEESSLRSLAEQLGFLKAGPRDVVEMHTQALRQRTQNIVPEKARAYLSESRLTVLAVMGDLVTYYRRYFIGLSQMKTYQRGDSS